MINVRKGTGHSLLQTDIVGSAKTSEAVVAGMLVQKEASTGDVTKLTTCINGTAYGQIGFAVNTQTDGDVIESGKIGLYLLDGHTVVETDQFTGTYTSADVGKAVVADGSTAGKVKAVAWADADTSRILGSVYDAPRSIFSGQTSVTVLPIKMALGNPTVAIS